MSMILNGLSKLIDYDRIEELHQERLEKVAEASAKSISFEFCKHDEKYFKLL